MKKNNNLIKKVSWNFEQHPYHLVDISFWPFYLAELLFILALWVDIFYLNYNKFKDVLFITAPLHYLFLFLSLCLGFGIYSWFFDFFKEIFLSGVGTKKVTKNIKIGMILFIISEIMIFVGLFWTFFHSSLSPNMGIGCIWPPKGIITIPAMGIPLLNTLILLTTGISITEAHKSFLRKKPTEFETTVDLWLEIKVEEFSVFLKEKITSNKQILKYFLLIMEYVETLEKKLPVWAKGDDYTNKTKEEIMTLLPKCFYPYYLNWSKNSEKFLNIFFCFYYTITWAFVFLIAQYTEYISAKFSMSTSVYGSTFYILTGCHGFHVFLGTTALTLCFILWLGLFYYKEQHISLELSIWYWHFVDIVWIILYIYLYIGNQTPDVRYFFN